MIYKIILLTIISLPALSQDYKSWQVYGGDAGGTRYSALTQINESNVHSLKPAWIFRTGELETYKGTNAIEKSGI
jgi:quinoprotein glucose dehydrogenase